AGTLELLGAWGDTSRLGEALDSLAAWLLARRCGHHPAMAQPRISGNVVRLRRPQRGGAVEEALVAATGDGSIRVLYRAGDEAPIWVDAGGARREPEEPSEARAATSIELDDEEVAVVEHDSATASEAIESACAALAGDLDREHRVAGLCAQVRLIERTEQRLRDGFEAVGP